MLKKFYKNKYKEDIETKIKTKCHGNMKFLYLTCLEANREENKEYSEEDINTDVEALYQASEAHWGSDDKAIM